MSLDPAAFPHIIEAIIAASAYREICALPNTSRVLRAQVDAYYAATVHHLRLCQLAEHQAGFSMLWVRRNRSCISNASLPARTLLVLSGDARTDAPQHALRALLGHVRVLEIITDPPLFTPSQYFITAILASARPHRIHIHGYGYDLTQAGAVDVFTSPHPRSPVYDNLRVHARLFTFGYTWHFEKRGPPLTLPPAAGSATQVVCAFKWLDAPDVIAHLGEAVHCTAFPSSNMRVAGTIALVRAWAGAQDRARYALAAKWEHLRSCAQAARNGLPLPPSPTVDGVQFLSPDAYRATRSDRVASSEILGGHRVGKVAIVTDRDVHQLATLANRAFCDYRCECDRAVQNDETLPPHPAIDGVTFMSLNAYKTVRGDKYELEGLASLWCPEL